MAEFGPIAKISPDSAFIFVSIPGVAPVITPLGLVNTLDYRALAGNTWYSSGTSAGAIVTKTLYKRLIPIWAIDYRGMFPNTTNPSLWQGNNDAGIGQSSGAPNNTNPAGYQAPSPGISIDGTIAGQVQENGVPVVGRTVFLYYRPTGRLITQTKSDSSGNYSFTGLEPGVNKYFVVAINLEPLQFDAVVHDTITPI